MTFASPEILYAADLNEGSEEVLAYAINVANHLRGKLHVMVGIRDIREKSLIEIDTHVPQDLLDEYHESRINRVRQHMEEKVSAFYAERKDTPARPIEAITVQEGDDIGDLILARAKEIGADLIIMSSRGRRTFSNLVFGSVAQDVLRETSIPLLLVPVGKTSKGEGS